MIVYAENGMGKSAFATYCRVPCLDLSPSHYPLVGSDSSPDHEWRALLLAFEKRFGLVFVEDPDFLMLVPPASGLILLRRKVRDQIDDRSEEVAEINKDRRLWKLSVDARFTSVPHERVEYVSDSDTLLKFYNRLFNKPFDHLAFRRFREEWDKHLAKADE